MTPPEQSPVPPERLEEISLDKARLHPRARKHDPDKLAELTASIKERGQLEPARGRPKEGYIEIYIGAGRFQGCQALEKPLKVLISEKSDEDVDLDMLHENIKRENLDPVTEAQEYQYQMKAHGWTFDQMAQKAGKGKSSIVQLISLLRLPKDALESVSRETISISHGELLLRLSTPEKQDEMAKNIIKEGWSVRKTEAEVAKELASLKKAKHPLLQRLLRSLSCSKRLHRRHPRLPLLQKRNLGVELATLDKKEPIGLFWRLFMSGVKPPTSLGNWSAASLRNGCNAGKGRSATGSGFPKPKKR